MAQYDTDENGFITIPNNPISKSGVFQYLGSSISSELEADKIYNVWRPPEELNNPQTIESFKLKPWIPEHVMLGTGFTDAERVGVRGVTGEDVKYVGDTLYSNLKLFGADLKNWIKQGLKELSCGFRCSWEIESGTTPEGEPYEVIQRNIRGNHLASVAEGRMGSEVSVGMDKAVFALDSIDITINDGENMTIKEMEALVKSQAEKMAAMGVAMDSMTKKVEDMEEKAAEDAEEEKAEDEDAEKAEDSDEDTEKAEDEDESTEKAEDEESLADTVKSLKAEVASLKKGGKAMDTSDIFKQVAKKQALASQVESIVGAFDHSAMTETQVAKYAVKKMGVACDSGAELNILKGILHARTAPTYTIDNGTAQDSSIAENETLNKMGLN